MKISTDGKIIKELQIALTYYIRGLTISNLNNEWTSDIQRIVEQALLTYTVIDIRKDNFMELMKIKFLKRNIKLYFSNAKCIYAKKITEIEVSIPYDYKNLNAYTLYGEVKIKIN